MSEAYIIEVGDEAVGIVVRQGDEKGYRFHASSPRYLPLEGKLYAEPKDAERAARARAPKGAKAAA